MIENEPTVTSSSDWEEMRLNYCFRDCLSEFIHYFFLMDPNKTVGLLHVRFVNIAYLLHKLNGGVPLGYTATHRARSPRLSSVEAFAGVGCGRGKGGADGGDTTKLSSLSAVESIFVECDSVE